MLKADGGSFRDPSGRVYRTQNEQGERRIVRGLSAHAASTIDRLLDQPFFRELAAEGRVVNTALLSAEDRAAAAVANEGWTVAVEHEAIGFTTWPYEWPFSMLKDAARLQLDLLTSAVKNGWMLKDATPYNVQWDGSRPVFIDVPSFLPRDHDEYWEGYRQFCSMYLTPLLLTAHLGIPFQPLLRSCLEGIPPEEAAKYFHGLRRFKRGVPSNIWFPAAVDKRMRRRSGTKGSPASTRTQSRTSLLALLDDLRRLVSGLRFRAGESSHWTSYSETHSYRDDDFDQKIAFVEKHTADRRPNLLWDLGANTGEFSRVAARHSGLVIAVDSDHQAVDLMYRRIRDTGGANITPLVMDLANLSPAQGWAGRERAAFEDRRSPDMVLCLALVHHMRVSANIPLSLFMEWLRSLDATAIVEFVGRDDEMFAELLRHKNENYADYTAENFNAEVRKRFTIEDSIALKGGKRELFLLHPLAL